MHRVLSVFICGIFLLFSGCTCSTKGGSQHGKVGFSLAASVPDASVPIVFDPRKPFYLEFGRGSGWHGLETLALDESGRLTKYTFSPKPMRGHATIDVRVLHCIADLLVANNVFTMKKSYSAGVHDGTQWILWVKQGGQEKSIYFDNYFPEAIRDFAQSIDAELGKCKVSYVDWSGPHGDADYQKAIWESIC